MYKLLTKNVADIKKGSIIIDNRDEIEGQAFNPKGQKYILSPQFNFIDSLYCMKLLIPIEDTYWKRYDNSLSLPPLIKIISMSDSLVYIGYQHDCRKKGTSAYWTMQGLLEQYKWAGIISY